MPQATYAHLAKHGFFYGESEVAYTARGGGPSTASRTEVAEVAEAPTDPALRAALQRNPLAESGLALAGANGETGRGREVTV